MNLKNPLGSNYTQKYITLVGFLILWSMISLFYSSVILPSPLTVSKAFVRIITAESFMQNMGLTLFRGISGYLSGMFLGIFLGVIMGKSPIIYNYIYPVISTLQAIPRISWILLAMVWFPLDSSIVIFIILITILPTITLNVLEGMTTVSKELLEMGRIFKVGSGSLLRDIYLPSITPFILSAAKISSGITWKSILMAELLTVNSGIGYEMAYSRAALATDEIIAYTLIILIIAHIHQRILKQIPVTPRDKGTF